MLSVSGKGIICKEPELRYTTSGTAICNATIVNSEEYNGKETAHFTNLVLFGERAEDFAKEMSKGCLVDIKQAILKHPVQEYQGKKYYKTEVTVLEWEFVKKFEKKEDKPEPPQKKQYGKKK
jgi:single-strand DNA-binding protein